MTQLPKDIFRRVLTNRAKHLPPGKNLPKHEEIQSLIDDAITVLSREPLLIELCGAFVVCGDLHGSVDDLLRVFEAQGYPPKTKYVFMGDYIDRGSCSTEVLLVLLSLKVMYSDSVVLLRGNHECDSMAMGYGFRSECLRRLNRACYKSFLNVFHNLPVAAIIGGRIMCVHGGITKSLGSIYDLKKLKKTYDVPMKGPIADMLWSDPDPSVDSTLPSPRGVGCIFGLKELNSFLKINKLDMIIRSHEACDNGFNYPFPGSKGLVTIFTVCDYCGEGNSGAVMLVDNDCKCAISELPVLSKKQQRKRRVIFPDWLINAKKKMKNVEPSNVIQDNVLKMRMDEDMLISV